MKILLFLMASCLPLLIPAQQNINDMVIDTIYPGTDTSHLRITQYVDSELIFSFSTSVIDTLVETKRSGFLWLTQYEMTTYVLGEKKDIEYGQNPNNVKICRELTGLVEVKRIK